MENNVCSIIKVYSKSVSIVLWDLNHNFHRVLLSLNTWKERPLQFREPWAELSFNNSFVLIFFFFWHFPGHSGINVIGLVSIIMIIYIFLCQSGLNVYKLLLSPCVIFYLLVLFLYVIIPMFLDLPY